MDAILWLAAVVVLLVIEIATLGLTTIWFAGGALIAGIAAVAGAGRVVQFVLFLIVSLILLIFTRPIAMRYLNTNRTRTNAESLIGKEAVVTQTIDILRLMASMRVCTITLSMQRLDLTVGLLHRFMIM